MFAAALLLLAAPLSARAADFKLPDTDAKLKAFQGVLAGIWETERDAKVLVFTEARETLESLQKALSRGGVEAPAFNGERAVRASARTGEGVRDLFAALAARIFEART